MNWLRSFDFPLDAAIPASRSDAMKVAVGFSPRSIAQPARRRVATLETPLLSHASLRDAVLSCAWLRGLKPTATVASSLRDDPRRIPTGFRPPAQGWRAAPTLGTRPLSVPAPKGLHHSLPSCNSVGVRRRTN